MLLHTQFTFKCFLTDKNIQLILSYSSNVNFFKKSKQEEQMLKRSIFAALTGLLHSHIPYLCSQPSRTSKLLNTTLQQNDCTNSSFLVIMWPGIKLQILVVFSIIPTLKQIGLSVQHIHYIKIMSAGFSPLNITLCQKKPNICVS